MNEADATPDALVATVIDVVELLNTPLAPEPGAVKVTFTPATGVPPADFTVTPSAVPNAVLIAADCDPEFAVIVLGTAADTVRVVVLVTLPAIAVMVTEVVVVATTVEATNVAELLPTETATDGGTVTRDVVLSEVLTVKVPELTAELSVTVHVLDMPPTTVDGKQETPVSVGVGWTIVTVAPEFVLVIIPPRAVLA